MSAALNRFINSINLQIEQNKTVTTHDGTVRTAVRCGDKFLATEVIDNQQLSLLNKNQYIVFNTQSTTIDCNYNILEKYMHKTLSSKIGFIFCELLDLIHKPELFNQVKSQKLKKLLLKLVEGERIDFNNTGENSLPKKWSRISAKFLDKVFDDGLVRLTYKAEKVHVQNEDEVQHYKKVYNVKNDLNPTFKYLASYIDVEFPIYKLLKELKKQLIGENLEKNEIEILIMIYQFIFKNIDSKHYYGLLDKTSVNDILQNNDSESVYIVDKFGEVETPTILLIKTFNSLAKHIDEILDEIIDIDETSINKEKLNLNLSEEEIDELKSINQFISKHYFGSIRDLKNEVQTNPRIKFEEFNEQLNLTANKVDKQKVASEPKKSKRPTYLSSSRPSSISLSLSASSLITSVNILDPDDISFKDLIPEYQRKRHTYILAGSGGGKTSLIETLLYEDCKNLKHSLIIFDLMGKATNSVAKFVEDPNRLLIVDPNLHPSITPLISPFEFFNEDGTINEHPSEMEIENRTNAIINATDIALELKEGWSVNQRAMLYPCISTLLRKGNGNFFELQRMMNDEINKDLVKLGKESPVEGHRNFFEKEFYNESYEVTKRAISAKIQVFLNSLTFTNLTTGKSTINLAKEVNTEGKIIIFKLTSKQKLFARLMMEMIQDIMRERINISEDKIVPTHIYLDEFQNYLTPTIEEILSESRNYKFYVTFAHQSFVQLSKKMQGIVLSNSNIKIVGQCSYDNGKKMAKEMKVDYKIIENLDQGEFVFKVGGNNAFEAKNTDKFIKDKTPYHHKQRTKHMKHQLKKKYYVYKKNLSIQDENVLNEDKLKPKHEDF